jgi:cyclopropane fatty-acyl-phospholipid synthase-like methyltransferase
MSACPPRIARAVELLGLRATDSVLEVGCGGGHALALMVEVLTGGRLVGIDRSIVQVKAARVRNRAAIAAGRLRVEQLSLDDAVEALAERFGKIVAVNVNAFWTAPERSLSSASSLLRAGGELHLVYEAPSTARARSLATALPELLKAHGFVVTRKELDGAHYAVCAKRKK